MKVSIIPWRAFWDSSDTGKDPAALDRWLKRWVFADEGVTISIREQSSQRDDFEQPVSHTRGSALALSTEL
jgi:hypothetical protein